MRLSALALLMFAILPAYIATAEDSIWSALVVARNAEQPKEPSPELARFQTKLKNVFGYNEFDVIARYSQVMDDPTERWIILSKLFCLRVAAINPGQNIHLLHLQLFQGERMLVETHAKLGRESPLFIRGPMRGNGQLIIVLLVK
ncbi:MAG: hypothetical protein M3O82_08750 [Verrucomicrobiota bacterium]|nr:hypothetical protein [Verrucomicrobiota bacterium]